MTQAIAKAIVGARLLITLLSGVSSTSLSVIGNQETRATEANSQGNGASCSAKSSAIGGSRQELRPLASSDRPSPTTKARNVPKLTADSARGVLCVPQRPASSSQSQARENASPAITM